MSLIPGNAYEKTIFPDGIQVDHISENTSGHGIVFDNKIYDTTCFYYHYNNTIPGAGAGPHSEQLAGPGNTNLRVQVPYKGVYLVSCGFYIYTGVTVGNVEAGTIYIQTGTNSTYQVGGGSGNTVRVSGLRTTAYYPSGEPAGRGFAILSATWVGELNALDYILFGSAVYDGAGQGGCGMFCMTVSEVKKTI
jgi:hypothetical protein